MEGTAARVHVHIPFAYLVNGWMDCIEICCVARVPVAMRFTQDGIRTFYTNASVTVTHLSTSIHSRSFIAPKGVLGTGAYKSVVQ